MTKITDIYEGGSHQMRHCDPCDMPEALAMTRDPSYSLLKHVIIESRARADDPAELEGMRAKFEARGVVEIFDAAQKCIRCAEGMCLIINGQDTNWQVGGSLAVE